MKKQFLFYIVILYFFTINKSFSIGLESLREYCVSKRDCRNFALEEFDTLDIKDLQDLAMDIGGNYQNYQKDYLILKEKLTEKIDKMTIINDKKERLIKYTNYLTRYARQYVSFFTE